MSQSANCPTCRPEIYDTYEKKRSWYAERAECLLCKEIARKAVLQGNPMLHPDAFALFYPNGATGIPPLVGSGVSSHASGVSLPGTAYHPRFRGGVSG